MATADGLVGSLVGGRYRVTRKLGEGGMGSVYIAVQEPLGREVALKVVKVSLAAEPQVAERFSREATALAKLAHPNIVTLHDFGVDQGTLYIAMELLAGQTLGARVRRLGAVSPAASLGIVRDIAGGLAVAHAAGIVHRDLKPDNIMIVDVAARGDTCKILDFGVAKANDAERLTKTGFAVGTPGYMAPELALSGITDDPRLDLYALGVIWFEMLTGRVLFSGESALEIVMKHAREPPPKPSAVAPTRGISAELDALVLRLLEKDPHDRPSSATELIAVIGAVKDPGTSLSLEPPPISAFPTTPTLSTPAAATMFRPFVSSAFPSPSAGLDGSQATETSISLPIPKRTRPSAARAAVFVVVIAAAAALIAIAATRAAPLAPPPPIARVAAPVAPPLAVDEPATVKHDVVDVRPEPTPDTKPTTTTTTKPKLKVKVKPSTPPRAETSTPPKEATEPEKEPELME